MKKSFSLLLLVIALIVFAFVVIYFFFPQTLVDFTNSQNAKAAGLVSKTVDINGYTAHYLESANKEKKETMVLVHGLGDDKNSFTQAAKFLKDDYNLILPDLLGSGENARDKTQNYSIRGQVEFLKKMLSTLGVEKFHVVGNSMGGHSAAAYTLAYPADVSSLTLLNAPGLTLDDHVVYTGFGKDVKDIEGLNAILARVFHKVPALPGPVAKLMIKQINDSREFLEETMIPQIKNGEDFDLRQRISRIATPTLVLWGRHDPVVTFNVAERYHRDIPLSQLTLLENGSHSPQLELPEEVATAIKKFMQQDKNTLLKPSKLEHAAKAQLYRWYQFYERDIEAPERLANQLNILDQDVVITSAAGEMKGRDNYPPRLSVYKGWTNAHHVQDVEVKPQDDGTIAMAVDIVYQNKNAEGERSNYTVHYDTVLRDNGKQLPVFQSLTLQPTGTIEKEPLEDAYPTNRISSLIHAWLFYIEQLNTDTAPFAELLAEDFALHFTTADGGPITTLDGVETWLKGAPSQLKQSNHYLEGLGVSEIAPDTYQVTVNFQWFGITLDDQSMAGKTQHNWVVIDDQSERFARIKEVKVKWLEPAKPI